MLSLAVALVQSALLSYCKKWHRPLTTRVTSVSTKNYQVIQTKLSSSSSFAEVILLLPKWPQSDEYLTKHEKIQTYKRLTLEVRATGGVKILNSGSCRRM